MNPTIKTNILRVGAALLLGTSLATHAARTDDTEIYLDTGAAFAADPIVMFYTEYTADLGSVLCSTDIAKDGSNITTTCDQNKDGVADYALLAAYFLHPSATNYPASVGVVGNNHDFADGKIDRRELISAAMKRVLIELGGMKVGIVAAHNDDNNCVGLSASECSNGAYILNRALPLKKVSEVLADASCSANSTVISAAFDPDNQTHVRKVLDCDDNKRELFKKINSIPSPDLTRKHPNQSKEVYFELFRYLTGKPVFNGHNGYQDYGTANNTDGIYNLGQRVTVTNNKGNFDCASGSDCTTLTSGTYTKNTGSGSYNGDFIEPLKNSGIYINTANLKWDINAETSTTSNVYASPIDTHCQRIFVINISRGGGTAQNQSDDYISKPFAEHGMNMTVGNDDTGFVQMVQNLHDYDLANGVINPNLNFVDKQNVTSFFLTELVSQTNEAAAAGGTGKAIPLSSDPSQLVNDLKKVFNQILSVSTTFVAASIPVNVFNRSEVIDNAYIALFQADANSKPRWMGDVKKLKLDIYVQENTDGSKTNKLQFIDALGTPAIAPDGRIDSNALTFWTNKDGYDITDAQNVTGNDPPVVDDRDGRAVTRGGAGQKIPGFLTGNLRGGVTWTNAAGGRKLYTEAIGTDPVAYSGSKLMNIEYDNEVYLWPIIRDRLDPYSVSLWPTLSEPLTGNYFNDFDVNWNTGCYSYYSNVSSGYWNPADCYVYDIVSNVVAYMRGYDVNATGSNAVAINAARNKTRRWIMGDPLHSRPLPINYGARPGYSITNPDIRIVFGSNDGYLRMLKNTGSDASELGQETWAFMPREVMKIQKQLMDNNIVGDTSSLPKHTYGVDGSPVAFVRDSDGTIGTCTDASGNSVTPCDDAAYVFFGLRRGGRGYYAMDITNPDIPKFKWKINNTLSDYTEMGYTFSQPVVRYMNWGTGVKPVLIVAGGYDLDKDITGMGSDDDMGRAIYIVDVESSNGSLVWKVIGTGIDGSYDSTGHTYVNTKMVDSIPSEVTAIDSNGDGLVDRIYVGDTGGKLWRIDLPGQSPTSTTDPRDSWKASVLMNVGRHWDANSNGSTTDAVVADDRRFFNAPDVVPTRDNNGNFDAIIVGTGNREHPLGTINQDYIYVYKDRCISQTLAECNPTGFTTVTPADLFDVTDNCLQMGTCDPANFTNDEIADLNRGWKLQLTASGEKSLAAPLTLRGTIYISTYVPTTTLVPLADDPSTPDIDESAMSCKPEGKGYFYAINLADGGAVFDDFSSEGEQDTPVTEDRKRELSSGGIPAENVYVSFRDPETGLTYTGVLPSDLDATDDLGTMQWRSFWYEKQR